MLEDEHPLLYSVLLRELDKLADKEAGEIRIREWPRVRWLIHDHLKCSDWPSNREPDEIVQFIYWNCWSLSKDATERWLASLPEKEHEALCLGEVLETLAPGLEWQMNLIADKNEGKLFYITGGIGGPIMVASGSAVS